MKSVLKQFVLVMSIATLLFAQEHRPEFAKNPFANNPSAATAGAKLYAQACLGCHGGEGRGDRGSALNGRMKHGNLDGEIFLSIRNGILNTQMPGFKKLTSDQVWQLVSYLRSLNPTAVAVSETAAGSVLLGEELFFGKLGTRLVMARRQKAAEVSAGNATVQIVLRHAGSSQQMGRDDLRPDVYRMGDRVQLRTLYLPT